MSNPKDKNIKDAKPIAPDEPALPHGKGSPYIRVIPPQRAVWTVARKLASEGNVRVEDLAVCAAQDPVLVMELIKVANALYFSAGRPPISTVNTSIIRLGSSVVLETLDNLGKRLDLEDPAAQELLETHRRRCRKASIIARMLSEILAKNFADECQTAGLLMFVGEMLAVTHFGPTYVELHRNNSASALIYKLSNDLKFDVERYGVNYLQRQGIPEILLFALEREGRSRHTERAIMKPICFASAEVVDAFDLNRWEKLAPGKQLPPKSSIRLLGLSDSQYARFYDRVSEYLHNERENKGGINTMNPFSVSVAQPQEAPPEPTPEEPKEEPTQVAPPRPGPQKGPPVRPGSPKGVAPTTAPPNVVRAPLTPDARDKFSLDTKPKETPRSTETRMVPPPPQLRTNAANTIVNDVTKTLQEAKNSEELLRQILGILTEEGPFEKSALIVVAKDRQSAVVVAARGPDITCGQTLILDDELSPLTQCFTKVLSFGNRSSSESPWGSKAYAIAPIDADHETPVALYADCGNDGSITFEARRVFRTVVDILNQRLPSIPGGIPVEV